jgi:hypothetical protein
MNMYLRNELQSEKDPSRLILSPNPLPIYLLALRSTTNSAKIFHISLVMETFIMQPQYFSIISTWRCSEAF